MGIDLSSYKKTSAKAGKPARATSSFSMQKLAMLLKKDISFSRKKWSDKKKENLFHDLSLLLSSGLDIVSALDLMNSGQSKTSTKALLLELKTAIVSGQSLYQAMEESQQFSPYEYYTVKIGEESGQLATVLENLKAFYTQKNKLRRQVLSALSYPLFVVFVVLGVVYFMLTAIVPMFEDLFDRLDGELPQLTQLVIHVSHWIKTYGFFLLPVALGLGLLVYQSRKKPFWQKTASTILLKLPVIGDTVRRIYFARFCQSMHLLLSAKTPLARAIDLVEKMMQFYPVNSSLRKTKTMLTQGKTLHLCLSQSDFFYPDWLTLIKVGEETNNLAAIFSRLYEQQSQTLDFRTKNAASLIEPILILLVAVLVGVILVAMYLPLFKLSTTF